jgi:hypothetical protein
MPSKPPYLTLFFPHSLPPLFSAFRPFFELLSATARQESFQTERESVATTSRVGCNRDFSETFRDQEVAFKLKGL